MCIYIKCLCVYIFIVPVACSQRCDDGRSLIRTYCDITEKERVCMCVRVSSRFKSHVVFKALGIYVARGREGGSM